MGEAPGPERMRGDNIGSVRGLVDASGTVMDTYELDTFGKPVSTTGTTPNPYRYGGAWGYITDPSGVLQLGVRHYWPEVGRFLQQDPLGAGISWYSYAADGPVKWVDPSGLLDCRPIFAWHHSDKHIIDPGTWGLWWTYDITYVENPVYWIFDAPVEMPWDSIMCYYKREKTTRGYWEKYWRILWACPEWCGGWYTKTTESKHTREEFSIVEPQTSSWGYPHTWVGEDWAGALCEMHKPRD